MRIEVSKSKVKVILSKRNLLSLLAKVKEFPKESLQTIIKTDPVTGILIEARGEPDELHYVGNEAGPGVMHQSTEAYMQDYRDREALITEANIFLSHLGQRVESAAWDEAAGLVDRMIRALEKAQQ